MHLTRDGRTSPRSLVLPGIVFLAFQVVGVTLWRLTGYIQPLFLFGYIGTALGIGLGLYATLPKKKKQRGRRLTLVLVGGLLLVFVGIMQSENMQIEWVFLALLSGAGGAALSHYLIAKVFGPVLFGRLWCGWACWTLMVLDLLPFQRSPGRLPGRWDRLRYAHFLLSLAIVFLLWWGFGYAEHASFGSRVGLLWMLGGNTLYYVVAVGMAFSLRDNRAFCKYICPIAVFLKATSRFALLKIGGDMERCNECGACVQMCPMDVRILDYLRHGDRVLSTECMLCQTCITVCARDALKVSFGLDRGGEELLRPRLQSEETAGIAS